MARQIWRGKATNLINVGPSKAFDYTTVQGALDYIAGVGDNASDNRYLVSVANGIYAERVDHNLSYVDLIAEHHGGAIIIQDSTVTTTGGTLRIGNLAAVVDVYIAGLRVIRDITGASKTGGGAPEGAVYLGPEEAYGNPCNWDRITLDSMIIEGSHDALQLFGCNWNTTGEAPYASVTNCILRSAHDALTIKGGMGLESAHNLIEVDTRGRAPYITDINDWKSTGIHQNASRPQGSTFTDFACWNRFFRSTADTIRIWEGANIGGTGQDLVAGILVYDQTDNTNLARSVTPVKIVSPNIYIYYDQDYSPASYISGINVDLLGSICTVPDRSILIEGGIIDIRQANSGGSAPSDIWGVRFTTISGDAGTMEIANTLIEGTNAGGSAHALRCSTSGSTLYSSARSRLSNDGTGSGTISALATV